MKMITWILCLCFTANVFASSGLAEVVDNYNYTMSVEWDQVDQDFYQDQTEVFVSNINALIANGLTKKEVEDFVSSKLTDKAALEEFAILAKNAKTTQDVVALLKNNSDRFYNQGASWNGEVVVSTVIGTIAAVYVIYVVYTLTHLDAEAE